MASNYTNNYGLCQWEATDQVLREEFNQDNAKVDAALQALAEQDAVLGKSLTDIAATAGNCDMETLSYTGTGSYGMNAPTIIRFSERPDFFMIAGGEAIYMGRGTSTATLLLTETYLSNMSCSWNGSQLSFYNTALAQHQMNAKNELYWVLALRIKK